MQTAATGYDLVLDPAAYQGIHLLEEDGIPMDTIWHSRCMMLLIAVVEYFFRDRPDFFTGGNNFIYFNPDQARNLDYRGPDFFFIKDGVDRSRERSYWAVWQEHGRRPDVIVELTSPTTEKEDRTTKFTIYEQTLRVPEYFLYDHQSEQLEGWRLLGSSYVPLEANAKGWLWSEELGLWLGTWVGPFLGRTETWLRLYTNDGELAPTRDEAAERRADQQQRRANQQQRRADEQQHRADEQQHRADEQQHRAEQAEQELARLRELLQRQAPHKPNGAQS